MARRRTEVDQCVAEEAGTWFASNWRADRSLGEWWRVLAESGWGYPAWPTEWFGRGLTAENARVVDRVRAATGALSAPIGIGTLLVAPMLLRNGSESQCARWLPALATGREMWCQLFSEPEAGSDLAGVTTSASRDGDEWVFHGQKVWTSGAVDADWAILLARTDATVARHRGLTMFVIDMRQDGIDVRPIRQMNGHAEFNEVFLDGPRAGLDQVVGGVGQGWSVTMDVLAHERDTSDPSSDVVGLMGSYDLRKPVAEFVGADGGRPEQEFHGVILGDSARTTLLSLLEAAGRRDDPVTRQRLALIISHIEIAKYAGRGLAPSLRKLASTQLMREISSLALALEGAAGTLLGSDAPLEGAMQQMALLTPGFSIAGGTDEIQKTIVGERLLGLPAEPRVTKP